MWLDDIGRITMKDLKLIDQDRKRREVLSKAERLEDLIFHSFSRNQENCFVKMKKTYKVSDGCLIRHSYNRLTKQ